MSFWSRKLTYLRCLMGFVLMAMASRALAADNPWRTWGAALGGHVPHEHAVGIYLGRAYDWSEMSFFQASWQALFDYESIWPHKAPEGLGIRFEGNVGAAIGTEFNGGRLMASGNFLAVYDLETMEVFGGHPYVEAGAGLIYTDFRRPGQGLRFNFNPVAGVGIRAGSRFMTLRLHHISNSGLDDENRGINSIVLGFGVYLGSHRP